MDLSPIVLIILVVLLLVNVGALIWLAAMHSRMGKRDNQVDAATQELDALRQQGRNLTMARILIETQDTFGTDIKAAINQITSEFKRDLDGTLADVSKTSGNEIQELIAGYKDALGGLRTDATTQMQAATADLSATFKAALDELKKAAEKPLEEMTSMVEEQRSGYEQRIQEEVKKHEMKLIAKFDAKVSDVVSNYLTETLGNDVDLGAQGPYLFRMLEDHKEDIKQEIINGA